MCTSLGLSYFTVTCVRVCYAWRVASVKRLIVIVSDRAQLVVCAFVGTRLIWRKGEVEVQRRVCVIERMNEELI